LKEEEIPTFTRESLRERVHKLSGLLFRKRAATAQYHAQL
jgi:hypothetical protein